MSTENPYQVPKAPLGEQSDFQEAMLATRSQRLGAAIIDAVIGMAAGVSLALYLGLFELIKTGQEIPFATLIALTALGFVFFVLIHGYFLMANGQTIGKKLVGIRIVTLANEVPHFNKLICLRYLPVSLLSLLQAPGNLLGLVNVLFIFRADRRCVHDLIAGTRVIKVSA